MSNSVNIDTVAIAIDICNKDAFKTQVFSATYSDQETPKESKKNWDEKVEMIAASLLEDYANLGKNQQEAVIGAVLSIALRMLTWIEFYAGTFNFSRDFCIEFLESALFTPEGIIDSQKVETKMSEEALSNIQRFQLASFYCQSMILPGLFNNLSEEDKNLVYNAENPELVKQPNIIKFWSYHSLGELDKVKVTAKIDQFRMLAAITSGSQLAVNYCLERTKSKQSSFLDTAVSIFRHRMRKEVIYELEENAGDWVVFRNKRYSCAEESWIPDSFFADIFYSLISNMSESHKEDFWRQICDTRFIVSDKRITSLTYANVLDCFLGWPYQEMFLEFFKSSWRHLSFDVCSLLHLKIINRIEPKKGQFCYGEEKFYDYRKMLMEAWAISPYVKKKVLFGNYSKNILTLLESMYNLKTFNDRDKKNAKSIIETATVGTRQSLLECAEGCSISIMLLESKKLDVFNELMSVCFNSSEKAQEYKLNVILVKAAEDCLKFIEEKKWDEAEATLKWSDYNLTEEEMLAIKNRLIYLKDGMEICINLWKVDSELADHFIRWCLQPEKVMTFKENLILCEVGQQACREMAITNPDTADNFLCWCLPLEMHIAFKTVLMEQAGSICMCTKYALKDNTPELADKLVKWCLPGEMENFKKFLGHHKLEVFPTFQTEFKDIENCTHDGFLDLIYDWTPADPMFLWCFASDPEETMKFKRTFLKRSQRTIIYKCIKSNNWHVADKFLSWLNLDRIGLRKAKTEQIYGDTETGELFSDLLSRKENDPTFAESGGKQRTIERFIHWFLVDDIKTLGIFMKKLERYSDDRIIQQIIIKLKASEEIETIKGLLMTP